MDVESTIVVKLSYTKNLIPCKRTNKNSSKLAAVYQYYAAVPVLHIYYVNVVQIWTTQKKS